MVACREANLGRSAYVSGRGLGRWGVMASSRESSSAMIFASTSGCCEMVYLCINVHALLRLKAQDVGHHSAQVLSCTACRTDAFFLVR